MWGVPIWPARADAYAAELDRLFAALLIIGALTAGLVFFLLILFAARYRAGSNVKRERAHRKEWRWEVSWTTASLIIFVRCRCGARGSTSTSTRRRPTPADLRRRQAMDVEGRSILAASARSTSCMCRSAATFAWCSRRRT